jgi:hypothetical protein
MTHAPRPACVPPAGLAALARAALLVGLLVVSPLASSAKDEAPLPQGPRRLVLLVLGGGVRASDVLDASRMPTAAALAEEGLLADALPTPRANAYLALRDLLTGRHDEADEPGRPPTAWPTLFEHVREQSREVRGARGEDVWFVESDAVAGPGLSSSTHPSYGPTLGALTARGDGAFGEPLKSFLEQMGRPLPVPEQVWPLLRRLRGVNRKAVGVFLPEGVDSGTPEAERVERAVLAELDRKAAFVKAASVGDEKATRAALTVLAVHRPRLLVLRLTGAEVGQQSVVAYYEALRQADQALGRLRAAVAADPALAGATSFAVATEMGRNAKPDASGGLGATEESPSRRRALLLATGPGFKKGSKPKGGGALEDVAPTLARWLGVSMPHATGRVCEECLAR